ncbi:MAG: MFS transporter, partial [Bacillota bacterium]
ADPLLPQELKEQLPPGGIPAQVRARMDRLGEAFEAALNGDEGARQALLADPQVPAEVRQALQSPPRDPAERRAVAASVRAALNARAQQVAAETERQVLARIRGEMDRQAGRLVALLRRALNEAITEAVRRVYLYAAGMALMGMLCLFFLPDQELRRSYGAPVPAVAGE